jgi:1,4-alpha-glucan branching enzyme
MSNEDTPVNALDLHLKARKHKPVATLKIHRMDSDDLYDPSEGKKAAQEHAKHLIDTRLAQFTQLNAAGIITPSIITVYEAELFGHWRFEGIPFLEEVLRQFNSRSGISLSSLHEISLTLPPNLVNPIPSSWGEGDYFENWLSPENAWIYPHLQRRATQLQRIVAALDQNIDGLSDDLAEHRSRCVSQMTRELLLAQSSDWAALMRSPSTQAYASKRFEDHLENFDRLATLYASNLGANAMELQSIERQTPLFPNLSWRTFSPPSSPSL